MRIQSLSQSGCYRFYTSRSELALSRSSKVIQGNGTVEGTIARSHVYREHHCVLKPPDSVFLVNYIVHIWECRTFPAGVKAKT